jgi:hypothetical protein
MSESRVKPNRVNSPYTPEDHDLWARHILVCFLQGLFNKLPREDPFFWTDSDADSNIVILAGTPVDRSKVGSRPLIAVDVGQYQAANIAMDQMRAASLWTGERLHTDLVPGSTSVYVIAKVETEARRLGGWIFRQIRYHHRMLQKVGGFHQIGQQLSVAPPSSPGQVVQGSADEEARMVTILVPWHLQWGWYIRPVAPEQQTQLNYFTDGNARDFERPEMARMRDVQVDLGSDTDSLQISSLRPGIDPLD